MTRKEYEEMKEDKIARGTWTEEKPRKYGIRKIKGIKKIAGIRKIRRIGR